jgi:hypothetical protein
MTDLDERLRAAGESFREQPVPDLNLHWPQEKHSHRWLAPLAIAAAIALIVGGIVAVSSWHDNSAQPPAKPSPPPVLQPDRNFAVAAPALPLSMGHGGGMYLGPPALCPPSTLRASAVTSAATDGVVGVITLVGGECSLSANPATIRLLDDKGQGLPVPVDTHNTGLSRPNVGDQSVRVGFAWTGAYCGVPAAAVELEVSGKPLRIPLHGPGPSCRASAVSRLVSGSEGDGKTAVVPPPAAWKPLRATLVLPKSLPWDQPVAVDVILTNTGSSDVSLVSPCASWRAAIQITNGGGIATTGSTGDFCSQPLTVKPGHPLHLHLGTLPLNQSSIEIRGAAVTVVWGISGVPAATATSVIQ